MGHGDKVLGYTLSVELFSLMKRSVLCIKIPVSFVHWETGCMWQEQ